MCTTTLKQLLDRWDVTTNMIIGDLYTFSMITGETFWFSNLGVPVLAEVPAGRVIATGTPAGSNSLGIAVDSLSAPMSRWIQNGQLITNLTHPDSIPPDTYVVDFNTDTLVVAMSNDAVGDGIQGDDWISFNRYYDYGPRFSRSKIKSQIGPQIDEMEVDMLVGGDDYIQLGNTASMTWQEAIFHGLFDGGYCKLDRVFFRTFPGDQRTLGECIGSTTWFYGRLSDITIGRTRITIKVKSLLDLLTIQMPRRLYQASCGWVFGAPGCDYDRVNGNNADGTSTGIGRVSLTAKTGSDQNHLIYDTGAWTPSPADIYDNGTIIMTSGQNNGYMRTAGMVTGGTIYFLKPFIFPVIPEADTFDLLPGCNHTQARCNDFNNANRFGGFPYIPPPETAV